MLRALLEGKLRLSEPRRLESERSDEDEDEAAWAAVYTEDHLTSCVFARLSYLSPDRWWRVLGRACTLLHGAQFPDVVPVGDFKWWFWPSLSLDDSRVEPDVIVEHREVVIAIEVKHWGAHDADQWRREVGAVREEYPKRRAIFIALGERNDAGASGTELEADVFFMSWKGLAEELDAATTDEAPPGERAAAVDAYAAIKKWGHLRQRYDSLEGLAPRPLGTKAEWLLRSWRPHGN